MGKTLQTICLMCNDQTLKESADDEEAKKKKKKDNSNNKKKAEASSGAKAAGATSSPHFASSSTTSSLNTAEEETKRHLIPGPTLVVAPSSAMWQWHDEIVRSTTAGALKIAMYYGQNRNRIILGGGRGKKQSRSNGVAGGGKAAAAVATNSSSSSSSSSSSGTKNGLSETFADDVDVVITTYPVLEYEYRKEFDRCKVRCAFCDKTMLPRKLELHYKYFCGPHARRTGKQAKTERKQGGKVVQSEETMAKGMATLGIAKMTGSGGRGSGGAGEKKRQQ